MSIPEDDRRLQVPMAASGKPLLGIAIPAYKRESLLARLLDSIEAELPIVVSDNGGHLSDAFKTRYPHVRFLTGAEVTVLENWNRAASALDTEWIVMPGDDDLYYPDSFTTIVDGLLEHAGADIAFFGHHIINEEDGIKTTWRPRTQFLVSPQGFEEVRRGTPARPPGIVFKTDLFRRLGGFNTQFKVTAGDNDFYQRATLIGDVACVDEVVTGYRVWEFGSTRQMIATQEWMREIDLWCSRVRQFATDLGSSMYPRSLQDDIYLDNLRAGIRALKERGDYWGAWQHFFRSRYPLRSRALNQLKLIAHLVLPHRP